MRDVELAARGSADRALTPTLSVLAAIVAAALLAGPVAAAGGSATEAEAAMRALYADILGAQNARDLDRVRATLWRSFDFLWVSDGRPFWWPDALVARMAAFQQSEVWRVEPNPERSHAVTLDIGVGHLSVR